MKESKKDMEDTPEWMSVLARNVGHVRAERKGEGRARKAGRAMEAESARRTTREIPASRGCGTRITNGKCFNNLAGAYGCISADRTGDKRAARCALSIEKRKSRDRE